MFIGATNRVDALDEAGVRSGRIDKMVHVGKPDTETRAKILHAQLKDRPNTVSQRAIMDVSKQTEGAVASDLELIVKEAAKDVLISGNEKITDEELKSAVDSAELT